ncbi:hypothetical protein [Streptomyces mutomycini]|uniref:Uncharacterized protein n=1 Tax=Streptomyces mutomycini TaxID=284036 RepID=A0ABW0B5B8_9ACTN|nr:hypothetical protein [Streptomyces mutomycini]
MAAVTGRTPSHDADSGYPGMMPWMRERVKTRWSSRRRHQAYK